jgi:hypothetical protein
VNVSGYRTVHGDSEMLYAVALDGEVYIAGPFPATSTTFNPPGRNWLRCAMLPTGAEFIGYYELSDRRPGLGPTQMRPRPMNPQSVTFREADEAPRAGCRVTHTRLGLGGVALQADLDAPGGPILLVRLDGRRDPFWTSLANVVLA